MTFSSETLPEGVCWAEQMADIVATRGLPHVSLVTAFGCLDGGHL